MLIHIYMYYIIVCLSSLRSQIKKKKKHVIHALPMKKLQSLELRLQYD